MVRNELSKHLSLVSRLPFGECFFWGIYLNFWILGPSFDLKLWDHHKSIRSVTILSASAHKSFHATFYQGSIPHINLIYDVMIWGDMNSLINIVSIVDFLSVNLFHINLLSWTTHKSQSIIFGFVLTIPRTLKIY